MSVESRVTRVFCASFRVISRGLESYKRRRADLCFPTMKIVTYLPASDSMIIRRYRRI